MSTVAPAHQASSSRLPSPHHQSEGMDEFFDLSAFGSSSSRESSPATHLPGTPDQADPASLANDAAFYQSLYAAAGLPQPAGGATSAMMGNSNGMMGMGLDNLKDATESWNSFMLSPSLLGSDLAFAAAGGINPTDDASLNLFSAAGGAPFNSAATGPTAATQQRQQQLGSPPLTAIESSPGSSPSATFAIEHTDSNPSSSSFVPTFGHPSFAIDPQLVAAPSAVGILRNSGAGAASSSTSGAPFAYAAPAMSAVATAVSAGAHAASSASSSRAVPKSRAAPRPSYHDDEEDDDEDDDDEDGDMKSVSATSSGLPTFGKAGSARKSASGIVQMGGITKQRVTSAVVALDKDPNDLDDWRPTPEEYKKLSSKEKRQLRNKISARNFRVRRKEYISTLEAHIADRDRLIEAIRQELGASKIEATELRQEVESLKRALVEGRTTAESLALPPPAPLDANGDVIRPISPVSPGHGSPASSAPATARSKLNKPNTRKDIAAPGSPAFWGGVGAFGGGVTPVHATLIPDITLPTRAPTINNTPSPILSSHSSPSATSSTAAELLSGKLGSAGITGWWGPSSNLPPTAREPENLNPRLNTPSLFNSPPTSESDLDHPHHQARGVLPAINGGLGLGLGMGNNGMSRFDAFMDANPFTIKSADEYRTQLWAQMAAARQHQNFLAQQQAQQQQQQQQQGQAGGRFQQPTYAQQQQQQNLQQSTASGSLLSALRPAFFQQGQSKKESSPQSPKSTLAALMSGKASVSSSSSSSYMTPPTSPRSRPATSASSSSQNNSGPTREHAMVAALASQTLLSRMSSAFFDAFSGSAPSSSSSASVSANDVIRTWDAEKVRKVLDGRAVVRVVDVVPEEKEKCSSTTSATFGLEEKLRGLSLRSCSKPSSSDE